LQRRELYSGVDQKLSHCVLVIFYHHICLNYKYNKGLSILSPFSVASFPQLPFKALQWGLHYLAKLWSSVRLLRGVCKSSKTVAYLALSCKNEFWCCLCVAKYLVVFKHTHAWKYAILLLLSSRSSFLCVCMCMCVCVKQNPMDHRKAA